MACRSLGATCICWPWWWVYWMDDHPHVSVHIWYICLCGFPMGALATLLLGGALGYFLLFTFSTSLTLFGMIIPKGSWNLLQLAGAKVVFGPMVFCARVCFTIFEWWWHQSVHWMLWSLSLLALPTIAFGIFTVQVSYIYMFVLSETNFCSKNTDNYRMKAWMRTWSWGMRPCKQVNCFGHLGQSTM